MKTLTYLISAIQKGLFTCFLFIVFVPVLLFTSIHAYSQQVAKELSFKLETLTGFLVYTPVNYRKDETATWPLILFLHGMGERGDSIALVTVHGPPKNVKTNNDFPFIVVSPQLSDKVRRWSTSELSALLDEIIAIYRIDTSRIYLTGLSMGGYGTWSWASAEPERFAAIAPFCGGGNPEEAYKIGNIPTWVFHGEEDKAVSITESEKMVEALGKAGGNVRFTRYSNTGHLCWDEAYDSGILYDWFLHIRK